ETLARVRNITWRPVTISSLITTDYAFRPITDLSGEQVGPDQTVELRLRFAARRSGPAMADLLMHYESDKLRQSRVMLDARGGQPTLAVAPAAVDFGELPAGGKVAQVIRIS